MRSHLALVPMVLAGALLAAPVPAQAADADVEVVGFDFTPAKVRVALGDRVTWTFTDIARHTSTSDQDFWDSGLKNNGQTFTWTFESAGSFGYVCTPHRHMKGSAKVPPRATGSAEDGWTLRWATGAAPDGRDYDVQVQRPGSDRWRWFRRDTERARGSFDPARSGRWQVRARTSNTVNDESSRWSPVRRLTVS